jgi:hypothetical protein
LYVLLVFLGIFKSFQVLVRILFWWVPKSSVTNLF